MRLKPSERPRFVPEIVLGFITILGLAGTAAFLWRSYVPSTPLKAGGPSASPVMAAPKDQRPTLYCEFNNFADPTPLVGFYFRRDGDRQSPAYRLIFRREQDGSQTDAGGAELSAEPWAVDGSGDSVALRSPDDETAINLYGDDPGKRDRGWFEAGLRSIRYRNLGGRCRHGA